MFCELKEDFRQHIKLGNEIRMSVMGIRNVRLKAHRVIYVITGVCYVPELKNNLLSMQQKGISILIQNGVYLSSSKGPQHSNGYDR